RNGGPARSAIAPCRRPRLGGDRGHGGGSAKHPAREEIVIDGSAEATGPRGCLWCYCGADAGTSSSAPTTALRRSVSTVSRHTPRRQAIRFPGAGKTLIVPQRV